MAVVPVRCWGFFDVRILSVGHFMLPHHGVRRTTDCRKTPDSDSELRVRVRVRFPSSSPSPRVDVVGLGEGGVPSIGSRARAEQEATARHQISCFWRIRAIFNARRFAVLVFFRLCLCLRACLPFFVLHVEDL